VHVLILLYLAAQLSTESLDIWKEIVNMSIGLAPDMIGWACAQPFPTLDTPLDTCTHEVKHAHTVTPNKHKVTHIVMYTHRVTHAHGQSDTHIHSGTNSDTHSHTNNNSTAHTHSDTCTMTHMEYAYTV